MKKWLMVLMCLCCVFGVVTLSACGGATDTPGEEGEEGVGPPPPEGEDAPTPGEGEGEGEGAGPDTPE